MQPSSRIVFNYPIYALDVLPGDSLAVAGGGGRMKSGIPNKCAVLSFHPSSASLTEQASVDLPDAVVALATSGSTLHAVIGPGVKNFSYTENKLSPHSSFRHDLRVSATQDQSAVAVSEDSTTLVVASDEGHVVSVSLPRYEQLFSARLHTKGITDLAISRDGLLVATTGRDRAAYLWTSRSGNVVQDLKPVMPSDLRTHIGAIRFCNSQPNILFTAESNPRRGGWMAAWARPSQTHATSYNPIASFKASADAITACAVNQVGSLVAVSSAEGHVSLLRWDDSSFSFLWSTETKTDWISAPTPPHNLPITGMSFSESGEYLFTASADATVTVWPIRRPTDWRRISRVTFWICSFLIGLFAVLVAEDHHLPRVVRYHRECIQPHLEPHLSKLQGSVRPFFRDRQAQIQPYISHMQDAIEPHLRYAGERIRPYTDRAREHRTRWKSIWQNTCNQLKGNRNYFASRTSLSTMKDQKTRETSDEPDTKGDFAGGSSETKPLDLEADYVEQKLYGDGRERDDDKHDGDERDGDEQGDGDERDGDERDGDERDGVERDGDERGPGERDGGERDDGERDDRERDDDERDDVERDDSECGGGQRDVGFKEESRDAQLSLDSCEADSQASGAETVTEQLVAEGNSDEETKTEPVKPGTAGRVDHQDLHTGRAPDGIALGEQVLYDVSRKVSLILSESSHTVTDAPQTEGETSASFAGSEGTVGSNRIASQGSA